MGGDRGEGETPKNGATTAMKIETEGTILLSTTKVNRSFVFEQLRKTVKELREEKAIR